MELTCQKAKWCIMLYGVLSGLARAHRVLGKRITCQARDWENDYVL